MDSCVSSPLLAVVSYASALMFALIGSAITLFCVRRWITRKLGRYTPERWH